VNSLLSEVLRIPCSARSVSAVRQALRTLCERGGIGGEMADDIVLAVSEATTNAVRYGCPTGGDIEVRWTQDGECTHVEVEDTGVFRKRIPIPELDEAHGRGIPLMIALVDEMHIREGTARRPGTLVRLVKCLP